MTLARRQRTLLVRKREDDEDDGRTPRVKEDDTAVEEEREKREGGRREKERKGEKIGEDGTLYLCTRVHRATFAARKKPGELIKRGEEKAARDCKMSRVSFCFSLLRDKLYWRELARDLRHV